MSSSIDTIGHKLQTLEERLQAENESRDCMVLHPQMPGQRQNIGLRPQHLGEITPTRPKKPLNLPVIQPQQAVETETDRKLKKIMKQNGILTINGKSYQSDIKDLEHIGDLGNGTSGHVVKMRHIPSGAIIAVKQMRRTGNSEENKRILMDLDVVLKSHDCKYIVQCLGCFITDLDVWICMELMAMCFDKLLKLSKMPVPEQILGKVTVATVKALSYLKDKQDVIHRDVKPSNILIDEKGNIKLCDFGISGRLVDSKANTRSAGCAAYMAPERIDPKKPKYDIRADVWSLGITLVELATACSPYEGCKTDFEVLTKVLDSDPPQLPKDQSFSQEFQDFVSKCLKKNHLFRPKYPELLEQPFIKLYETKCVDVSEWFRSVVELTGIKPHRRIPLPSDTMSTIPTTATTIINHPLTIKASQIPNYQCNKINKHTYQNTTQQQQQHQQQQHHQQHHDQQDKQYQGNKSFITNHFKLLKHQSASPPFNSSSTSSSSPSAQPLSTTSTSLLIQPAKTHVYQPLPKETNGFSQSQLKNSNGYQEETNIVGEMNKLYKKSPFFQRKRDSKIPLNNEENHKRESMLSSLGQSLLRNMTASSFSQKKVQNQPEGFWKFSNPPDGGGDESAPNLNSLKENNSALTSPIGGRKRLQTSIPVAGENNLHYARLSDNTSPIVLQRFYHQQNQLRERESKLKFHNDEQNQKQSNSDNLLTNFIPKYNFNNQKYSQSPNNQNTVDGHYHHNTSIPHYQSSLSSNPTHSHLSSNIPIYSQQLVCGTSSCYGAQNVYSNNLYGETMTQQSQHQDLISKDNIKNEQGVVKKQFASYVKVHLTTGDVEQDRRGSNRSQNYQITKTIESSSSTASTSNSISLLDDNNINNLNTYYKNRNQLQYRTNQIPPQNLHILSGIDRRHRSPDPPPRYNRGQSPLLLRKNLLELGGHSLESPLLSRRYPTASPPLPPPRRGSESVPGSPQHFRTRIHYTPEPQRRIYRTIDQ